MDIIDIIIIFINNNFWIINTISLLTGILGFLGIGFVVKRKDASEKAKIFQIIIGFSVVIFILLCSYVHENYIVVPNVKTLSLNSAKQELQSLGFNIECDIDVNVNRFRNIW